MPVPYTVALLFSFFGGGGGCIWVGAVCRPTLQNEYLFWCSIGFSAAKHFFSQACDKSFVCLNHFLDDGNGPVSMYI